MVMIKIAANDMDCDYTQRFVQLMRFVKQIKCTSLFRNKGAFWFESEYGRDLKSNHLKFRIFEDHISNGPGQAIVLAIAIDRPFEKPDVFQRFLTKLQTFVQISNGRVSRYQILFEIQTICKPIAFGHSDFRSPMYIVLYNVNLINLNSGYTILNNSLSNNCCVFRPANRCSARHLLVEIDFLTK